ncbi:MAG: AMP-binding protein, partial [bacterium]
MYIGDYLRRRCVFTPEKIGIVDATSQAPERFTYRDLNERANRLAYWLRAAGVKKGDRVALLAYDGIHFYDVFFACGKLGAILAPYNWRLHAREVESQIRLTGPKILFHDSEAPINAMVADLQSCAGM